jgi:hypothetical protein
MSALLDEDGAVLLHPWVIGELVLGGLSEKEEAVLKYVPRATEVSNEDMIRFVRTRKIVRRGIGWVDAQLVASALIDAALLWAIDEPLESVASELKIAFAGELRD